MLYFLFFEAKKHFNQGKKKEINTFSIKLIVQYCIRNSPMKLKESQFFSTHNKEHVYDSLTNAVNKDYLKKYADFLIENGGIFSMYFIDIDNFESASETKGITASETLLKDIATGIENVIGQKGVLFRYGGDEFVVIVPNIATYEDVWNIARDISESIRHLNLGYLTTDAKPYPVTLTMGITRHPIDAPDFEGLLKNSEKALFRGKMKGKNCFIIYNRNLHGDINVAQRKSSLNVHGLVDYIFEMFRIHDTAKALSMVSHMLGNYYSAKSIYLITSDAPVLLYQDPQAKISGLPCLKKDEYRFNREETYHVNYFSLLKKDDDYEKKILALMERRKTRSFIIFRTKDKEGNLILVESGVEKVWSEMEILLYLTMSNVYSMVANPKNCTE